MAVNQAPTNSTLEAIKIKVRRLTRKPDESLLSDDDLEQYINTFVLYDFPEHLRLFNLRTTLTFYTAPNVARYESNTTNPTDPLYDFTNRYITVHPPVYVAGVQIRLTQSREEFFTYYPQNNYIVQVAVGDGTTGPYTGTIPTVPVLQNTVSFTSIDANNGALVLVDVPLSSEGGSLIVPDDPTVIYGTVNYLTGAFNFTFPTAAAANVPINCQAFPYPASMPNVMLFYAGAFEFRPVPDQAYRVTMDVWQQPTQLLSDSQVPLLSEFWQYIAYGTAKKIFEDQMDMESVQLIMPEFKQQERLILRRTLVQQSNERAATIYQYGNASNQSAGWYYGGTL